MKITTRQLRQLIKEEIEAQTTICEDDGVGEKEQLKAAGLKMKEAYLALPASFGAKALVKSALDAIVTAYKSAAN